MSGIIQDLRVAIDRAPDRRQCAAARLDRHRCRSAARDGGHAFLSSIFYGLRAFDPLVFAAGAVLLGAVALPASWCPARTAARVDPLAALKN